MTTLDHPHVAPAQPCPALLPLDDLLGQLAAVLAGLTDEQYTRRPVAGFESSLGAHLRHCLDHVRELLLSATTGHANFDARHRDTLVQSSRQEGLAEIERLRRAAALLGGDVMPQPVRLSVLLTCDGSPLEVGTTFGRELAFVLSHTVHHNAIIGAMVKALGAPLPDRFGYAPSTLQSLRSAGGAGSTCAR